MIESWQSLERFKACFHKKLKIAELKTTLGIVVEFRTMPWECPAVLPSLHSPAPPDKRKMIVFSPGIHVRV
jgi:hypothetical protein